jgi:general secretion pathway protein L
VKKFDWTSFFPGHRTIFVFPEEVVAVRVVRVMGRILSRQMHSWPCSDSESIHRALVEAKAALRIGKDTLCHVGLPLEDMTLVDFTLPMAARDDLSNAVRYSLMRHVPFDLDQMRWEFSSREREGNLEVAVSLMQRPALSKVMERFSLAGTQIASVFPACMLLAAKAKNGGILALVRGGLHEVLTWNGHRICWRSATADDPVRSIQTAAVMLESYGIDSRKLFLCGRQPAAVPQGLELEHVEPMDFDYGAKQEFRIDLVPESTIRNQRRSRMGLAIVALVLLLTLAFLPFRDIIVWERRVTALEGKIALLRSEAETLVDVRQQNAAFEKRMERWARHFASNPDAAQLLREITEVVPAGAWLDSLQLQERKIIMSGSAPSATVVLEQLENSPLFHEMRFDAPVTKQGQLEIFRIAGSVTTQ